MRTPGGAVSWHAEQDESGVVLRAWGPGAGWVERHAADLLGMNDDPLAFAPDNERLARLHRTRPLYLPRTRLVIDRIVPVILHQLVTWKDAMHAYRGMVRALGEPAPGPFDLRLPPTAEVLARTPTYVLSEHGALQRQAATIQRVARVAGHLSEVADMPLEQGVQRLESVVGVGPWTSHMTLATVLGDADLVPLGDVNLPLDVGWALAGEPRADDARMLELLEPFRPHRGRVVAAIREAGISSPRPRRKGRTQHRAPPRGSR